MPLVSSPAWRRRYGRWFLQSLSFSSTKSLFQFPVVVFEMPSFLLLLLAIGVVPVWSFSLDTPTKYWNYTTASLSSTTSPECKAAYSAHIDCDDFLLALAVSKEDRWWLQDFDSAVFDRTCTATCQSSLSAYVANVEQTCNKARDAACKTNGPENLGDPVLVPVVTLGHILQYVLMRSCAKDE